MTRTELLASLGVPEWLTTNPQPTEVWIRLKTEGAKVGVKAYDVYRLGHYGQGWSIHISTHDPIQVRLQESWSTGGWVETSSSEGAWGQGYYEEGRDHSWEAKISSAYRTWEEARGGWPLPEDRVIADVPWGELHTTIHAVLDPKLHNGAPMVEVAGGLQLPLGCLRPPEHNYRA